MHMMPDVGEPAQCQKKSTVGAKGTYYVRTFESLPAIPDDPIGVRVLKAEADGAQGAPNHLEGLWFRVHGLGFRVSCRV